MKFFFCLPDEVGKTFRSKQKTYCCREREHKLRELGSSWGMGWGGVPKENYQCAFGKMGMFYVVHCSPLTLHYTWYIFHPGLV